MTEFNILGPAELRNINGELEHSFLAGPKRLALLSFLLLKRPYGFHRRDSLLPLFWPDQDQKGARNALSNMLYHIRKTIGKDAIKNRGSEEIMVNCSAFKADAIDFEDAILKKDFETALGFYRSDLLKGFYVSDISPEFDHWLELERKRFHSLATEGSLNLADKFYNNKDYASAIKWTQRAAELNPDSEEIHIKLISLYNYCGNKKAALEVCKNFTEYLRKEWDEEPGPEFDKWKAQIKARNEFENAKLPIDPFPNDLKKNEKTYHTSIAVLPFLDLGSRELHFAEGIHGDILTALSRINNLHVISRTSVRHYQKSQKGATEIGKELNVTWLLEGEVQQVAKEIRTNIRLINASSDSQVWSEVYQHKLTAQNIFLIQDEVTRDILETLKIQLSPKEKSRSIQNPTLDLDAYRLYTLGRTSLDLRTEAGIYRGFDFFQASIEIDPEYALAWAGLADALSLLKYYALSIPKNALTPLEAASKAVALDPGLGETHNSLGIAYSGVQNGPAALKELELAIKLTPSYAEAYIWFGWVYIMVGKPHQGLEMGEKAVRLNPLSSAFRIFLAIIYLSNQKYYKALEEAQRAREINPEYGLTHFVEGLALYHLNQLEDAFSAFKRTLPLISQMGTPCKAEVQIAIKICNKALGHEEGDKDLKEEIYERINPFSFAMLYALEGELTAAFQTFDRVQDWGSFSNEQIRYCFPQILSALRKDARYSDLIAKVDSAWGMNSNGDLPLKEQLNTHQNNS